MITRATGLMPCSRAMTCPATEHRHHAEAVEISLRRQPTRRHAYSTCPRQGHQRANSGLNQSVLNLSTWLIFTLDGANDVSTFVMRSTILWNMDVPLDNSILTYRFLTVSASHLVLYWIEVSWKPQASVLMKLGWYNTSAQWKHPATSVMMFPSGSM